MFYLISARVKFFISYRLLVYKSTLNKYYVKKIVKIAVLIC